MEKNISPYVFPGIDIIIKLCSMLDISKDLIFSKTRKQEIIIKRYPIIYALSKTRLKPPAIAKKTGFDRTTILYAIKKCNEALQDKRVNQELYNNIKKLQHG